MAQNVFRTVQRLLDATGEIEPGATIEFYTAGTTTPLTVYSDRALTTTAGSSVTADASGAVAERWLADTAAFKLVYKDSDGNTVYTRDYANDDNEAVAELGVVFASRQNVTGDTDANVYTDLQALFTYAGSGGVIDGEGKTYLVGTGIVPVAGTAAKPGRLRNITIKAHSSLPHDTVILRAVSHFICEESVTIDGGEVGTATVVHYGVSNAAAVTGFRFHGRIINTSFTGLFINSNNGAWANSNLDFSDARVENVGWSGISVDGTTNLRMDRISVKYTGYDAVRTNQCANIQSHGAYVTKETEPFVIYNGPGGLGGTETGSFWSHLGCSGTITGFLFDDNLNAGYDGIGLNEDGGGPIPESANLYWQGRINKPGGFGYDASSNSSFDLIITNGASNGIFIGQDLGGTLENIQGHAIIQDCTGDAAVYFGAPSQVATTITTTNGSTSATVADATYVAIGQRIYSANVPSGATVTAKSGTTITLSAAATATASGTAVTFRATTNFKNINILAVVDGCDYAVGVFDGTLASNTHGTYSNVVVRFRSQNLATDNVLIFPTTTEPDGIFVDNQTHGNDDATLGEEWNATTGAVTASSGTITTATGAIRWLMEGRTVHWRITVTITTNGTGSGAVRVALPFSVQTSVLAGRANVNSGKGIHGYANGTSISIVHDDATYPGTDGEVLILSGISEAA